MNWFRRDPPPKPFYKKNLIATSAIILTVIGMFILGPIGVIYNGLTEDLKNKANNETVLMYMKQQKETDDRQWKAIEQQIQTPKQLPHKVTPNIKDSTKSILTPKQFEDYMNMNPEYRTAFRKLHPSYATLPE